MSQLTRGLRATASHVRGFVAPVVGAVLVAAGCLKLVAAPVGPVGPAAEAATVLALVIDFGLGYWLVSGWWPRPAVRSSVAVFALFALINVFHLAAGRSSCGCFGDVPVSPWATLGFDVAAATGLVWARPARSGASTPVSPHWSRPVITLGLCSTLVVAVPLFWGPEAQERYEPVATGREAVGRPFALASVVIDGDRLVEGRWVVMLYRQGCQACEVRAADLRTQPDVKLAFLRVPQSRDSGAGDHMAGQFTASLPEARHWVVQTPAVFWLEDGIVTHAE